MPAVVESRIPGKVPAAATPPPASLLQWPLFGDEHLLIQCWNIHPTTTAIVGVTGRFFSEQSQDLQIFSESLNVPAGATGVFVQQPLTRGALLALRLATGTLPPGNVWARVTFSKGLTPLAALTFPATILQGYLGIDQDLAWPGSPIQLTSDGKGVARTYQGNVVFPSSFFTVPANRRWKVLSATELYTTSAVVGNRYMNATAATAGGDVLFRGQQAAFQPASITAQYSIAPGAAAQMGINGNANILPFPVDLDLRGGDLVSFEQQNSQAGDTVTFPVIAVREWFDPDS